MGRRCRGWFEVREVLAAPGAWAHLTESQARYMRGYFCDLEGQTMRTVAEACGVDISTVSRVVHNGCDKLVEAGYLAQGVL